MLQFASRIITWTIDHSSEVEIFEWKQNKFSIISSSSYEQQKATCVQCVYVSTFYNNTRVIKVS